MEADLARFYGLQLADVGTPQLTWRRLAVLLRQLPREARLLELAELPAQWGHSEWLLARLTHATEVGVWQRGGGKGRRPRPLRPPGMADPSRISRTTGTPAPLEDMAARLEARRRGERPRRR